MKQSLPPKALTDQMACLDKVTRSGTAFIKTYRADAFSNWYDCHLKLSVSDFVVGVPVSDSPLVHIPDTQSEVIASKWNDLTSKLTEGLGLVDIHKYFNDDTHRLWDTHWDQLKLFDYSLRDIDETVEVLASLSAKRDSNARVQTVTNALNLNRKKFRGHYYTFLQKIKQHLSADEFYRIKRALSSQMEAIHNVFSRLRGKIKSVARSLSFTNLFLDRRVENRKKLKVILRQSDDEDNIL